MLDPFGSHHRTIVIMGLIGLFCAAGIPYLSQVRHPVDTFNGSLLLGMVWLPFLAPWLVYAFGLGSFASTAAVRSLLIIC